MAEPATGAVSHDEDPAEVLREKAVRMRQLALSIRGCDGQIVRQYADELEAKVVRREAHRLGHPRAEGQ